MSVIKNAEKNRFFAGSDDN